MGAEAQRCCAPASERLRPQSFAKSIITPAASRAT